MDHDATSGLTSGLIADLGARLADADEALAREFPGARPGRQSVHTVYVPADRYAAGLAARWGAEALTTLDAHPDAFVAATGAAPDEVERVRAKLAAEPIEDLRIDFEDGLRAPYEAEDGLVAAAAAALREDVAAGTAPAYLGIRYKSFEAPTRERGIRTLVGFVEALTAGGAPLPPGFGVTLPKVTSVDQVEAMVVAAERIESALGLADGALGFEIQIETPQSILGPDGTALVARMIHASGGRCTGLHYGTYDYSAFCGVAAAYQSMEHPVADHAKAVMQAAAAGTGVRLSDGSTNIIPVGDPAAVEAGWALHHRLVRRSLERAFYQGWDLHPAQLPTRYAATFGFYREGLAAALARLTAYLAGPEGADGTVMDEPATARALADYVLRGLDCGAVASDEVGIPVADLAVLARRTS